MNVPRYSRLFAYLKAAASRRRKIIFSFDEFENVPALVLRVDEEWGNLIAVVQIMPKDLIE